MGVIDPAIGFSGKADHQTTQYLQDQNRTCHMRGGVTPFRILREPFDRAFVSDPSNAEFLNKASALVSFYPDEVTDFIMLFSASTAKRTVMIPCNECTQYF